MMQQRKQRRKNLHCADVTLVHRVCIKTNQGKKKILDNFYFSNKYVQETTYAFKNIT